MSYATQFVQIDGKWHEVAEFGLTACGIPTPFPGTVTNEQPDKIHCGANATKEAPKAEPEPAPVAAKRPASKAKAKK